MSIHPLRAAREQGRREGIEAAIAHLRAKAALQQSAPGDQRRRGVLNAAADELRDGREPQRPPRRLGWLHSPEGRIADAS